jgi:hypothetical protein
MAGGGGDQTSTTQQTIDPVLAREIGPFAAFTKNLVRRPYERYRGQLVSGFNPDQQAAFERVRQGSGAQEQYAQLLGQGPFRGEVSDEERAAQAGQDAAAGFTGSFFDPKPNEFFESQLGIGRRRLGEQFSESIAPQLASKYALSGAFGGSAQAEAEGRSQRELARGLGEYESGARSAEVERRLGQGLQAAGLTGQARGLAEQIAARRGAQGLQEAGLRGSLIGQQEGAYGADLERLLAAGGQQQGQAQAGLNALFSRFQDRRNYPERQFNIYRDAIAAISGAAPRGQTTQTSGGGK